MLEVEGGEWVTNLIANQQKYGAKNEGDVFSRQLVLVKLGRGVEDTS